MTTTATAPDIVPNFDTDARDGRKLAIICSKGSLDLAYPGLILANAALGEGVETHLFFTFSGFDLINKKTLGDLPVSSLGDTSAPRSEGAGGLPEATTWARARPTQRPPARPAREGWTALRKALLWGRLGLSVGALLAYFGYRHVTKPRPPVPAPPPRPPWEIALEKLDEVRHAGLLEAHRDAEYFDRVRAEEHLHRAEVGADRGDPANSGGYQRVHHHLFVLVGEGPLRLE